MIDPIVMKYFSTNWQPTYPKVQLQLFLFVSIQVYPTFHYKKTI
jgi:hypothetical protein